MYSGGEQSCREGAVTLDPAWASLRSSCELRTPWPAELHGASLSLSVTSLGDLWNWIANVGSAGPFPQDKCLS